MSQNFVVILNKKEYVELDDIIAIFPVTVNEKNELIYKNSQLAFLQYKCFEEIRVIPDDKNKAQKEFMEYMEKNTRQVVIPKDEFYKANMEHHLYIINTQINNL